MRAKSKLKNPRPPKRSAGPGDFERGTPIADAVDRFRELADLHWGSADDSLVVFAYGSGRERPGAAAVRAIWGPVDELGSREAPEDGASSTHGDIAPDSGGPPDRSPEIANHDASPIASCAHLTSIREGDDWVCANCGLIRDDVDHETKSSAPPDINQAWMQDALNLGAQLTAPPAPPNDTDEDWMSSRGLDASQYVCTDGGVREYVIHSPLLMDVDEHRVHERRRRIVTFVGLDDHGDATDNEIEPEEIILF